MAIDFELEEPPAKLTEAGFRVQGQKLFLLEGLLMYLTTDAVDGLFRLIEQVAGPGSRVVFDYIKESILTGDEDVPGARQALASVRRAREDRCFALAPVISVVFRRELRGAVARPSGRTRSGKHLLHR